MECQSHAFPGELRRALEGVVYGARCRVEPSAVRAWRDRHQEFDRYAQRQARSRNTVDMQQLVALDKKSCDKVTDAFAMRKCRNTVRTLAPSPEAGEELNTSIAAARTHEVQCTERHGLSRIMPRSTSLYVLRDVGPQLPHAR